MNIDSYNRALVTGGAGFIGSHLCEELLNLGLEVISVDDFSAGKQSNIARLSDYDRFTSHSVDVSDVDALRPLFDDVDIVFHNGASKKNICLKDPRRDLAVNAMGTYNMLELSRDTDVKKFVHASTGSVYKPTTDEITETSEIGPVSYYGVSKLAGERYVQTFHELYDLDTTILRYFHVYGPRQESGEFGGVVAIFIRNLLNGEAPVIHGDGQQLRSFTWVKDVVNANIIAATSPEAIGKVYNCASGIKVTIAELCALIVDLFGVKDSVIPDYGDWLPGDIKYFNVSNKAISDIGMEFSRDYRDNIAAIIDDIRSDG
jgi:UDP-glucose 4-epimerase